ILSCPARKVSRAAFGVNSPVWGGWWNRPGSRKRGPVEHAAECRFTGTRWEGKGSLRVESTGWAFSGADSPHGLCLATSQPSVEKQFDIQSSLHGRGVVVVHGVRRLFPASRCWLLMVIHLPIALITRCRK